MQTMRRGAGLVVALVLAVGACKKKPHLEPQPVASAELADAQSGVPIAVAAFTIAATTGVPSQKSLELRGDGTVLLGGKEYAKVVGDKIVDLAGATIVRVTPDGSLEGELTPIGQRFVGDDLQRPPEMKISVANDGNVSALTSGTTVPVATVVGGQSSKRAVILLLLLRERQEHLDRDKALDDITAEVNNPCLRDPSKTAADCITTTPPPPPPPPPPPSSAPKRSKKH